MVKEIILPKFDQSMEEATIAAWTVKVGDEIKKGQVICEIETDKAAVEIESNVSGILREIRVRPGETIPVNTVIGIVGEGAEEVPACVTEAVSPPAAGEPPKSVEPVAGEPSQPAAYPDVESVLPAEYVAPSQPAFIREEVVTVPLEAGLIAPGRKAITPKAMELAKSLYIPILAVDGSGPNGKVNEADVRAYYEQIKDLKLTAEARNTCFARNVDIRVFLGNKDQEITKEMAEVAPQLKGGVKEPLNAMRSTIAKRLSLSKRLAPHFYLSTSVDMSAAVAIRQEHNKSFTLTDLIIKAVGLALRQYTQMASVYTPEGYVPRDHMNIGFAVAIEKNGLVVPVVRDTDRVSLAEVSQRTKELVERARNNRLTQEDYSGGVFTISNLGMYDVEDFAAIINPGESAILAVGTIIDTPVARDGQVVIRSIMKLTLSCDHRVIDGSLAAEFISYLKSLLECPNQIVK